MSRSTISTFELFQMFPDAESARAYFEQLSTLLLVSRRIRMIKRLLITVAALALTSCENIEGCKLFEDRNYCQQRKDDVARIQQLTKDMKERRKDWAEEISPSKYNYLEITFGFSDTKPVCYQWLANAMKDGKITNFEWDVHQAIHNKLIEAEEAEQLVKKKERLKELAK
jgi:hypothetical protein